MPRGDVLFINKTSKSKTLTRSTGLEKAKIFSHVQRSPNRPSVSRKASEVSSDHSEGSSRSTPEGTKLRSERRPSRRTISPSSETCHYEDTNAQPSGQEEHGQFSVEVETESCKSYVPFADPYISEMLEFYSSDVVERVFPNREVANAARTQSLAYAAQDQIALNAILATTCGAMGSHSGDLTHVYDALHYKGEAIRLLKSKLSEASPEPVEISTLYAVSLLLYAECLQGDLEAVKAHVTGLEHLVPAVKGLSQSPYPIVSTILCSTYYSSAMIATPPLLEPIILCRDRISPTLLNTLSFDAHSDGSTAMASRFFSPSNAEILGPEMILTISQTMTYHRFRTLSAANKINATYEDMQYIYTTQLAIDYRLLCMAFNRSSIEGLTPIQNAARIALYAFAQPIVGLGIPSSAFNRAIAKQLKASLDQLNFTEMWESNCDLLLWVLLVASNVAHDQEEWPFLIANIATCIDYMGLESVDDVREVLQGFFYLREVHEATLLDIWSGIELYHHMAGL